MYILILNLQDKIIIFNPIGTSHRKSNQQIDCPDQIFAKNNNESAPWNSTTVDSHFFLINILIEIIFNMI